MLFKDFILDPIPTSVQILNSAAEGSVSARDMVFIQFTISTSDLESVVRKFKDAGFSQDEKTVVSGPAPSWWKPPHHQLVRSYARNIPRSNSDSGGGWALIIERTEGNTNVIWYSHFYR